ncbi:MAG: uroporphyrinogen decarboxylase family protein [Planctomycetota bacterium]
MSSERVAEVRAFLKGGPQGRGFVRLDPSTYAAVFAGRPGGTPTIEDEIAFHRAFPNDAMPALLLDFEKLTPDLCWRRRLVRRDDDGRATWEETVTIPSGEKRRIVVDQPGTQPWLLEPAVKSESDFDIVEFYAEAIREHASSIADALKQYPPLLESLGMLPAAAIFSAFEAYWLINYPDMPLFYMDFPRRYLASIRKVHEANLVLLEALAAVGFELFYAGSAGLELLSPRIFREAIVPFQREFNDRARALGVLTSYHVCGHSEGLIRQKIIDDIRPTIFETCSTPPCGDNPSLGEAVRGIAEDIITKGNLPLELLRNGSPREIAAAVRDIARVTGGRRHIIGQADATILTGTPYENIRAFLDAASP